MRYAVLLLVAVVACEGPVGPAGENGTQGPPGQDGTDGTPTRLVLSGASAGPHVFVPAPEWVTLDAPPIFACYEYDAPADALWVADLCALQPDPDTGVLSFRATLDNGGSGWSYRIVVVR